jgi:hypothetical protein
VKECEAKNARGLMGLCWVDKTKNPWKIRQSKVGCRQKRGATTKDAER